MAIAKINGIKINYQVEGQDEPLATIAGMAMDLRVRNDIKVRLKTETE